MKLPPYNLIKQKNRYKRKLIEIVLNQKEQRYELSLNQEMVKIIETIDQSKKLCVYSFIGKAG